MTTVEENDKGIQNFCNNIKVLRKTHSLSKTQMAKIMKVSITTLSKIESGIMPNISCEVLFNLSTYFKIAPANLFLPTPPQP